MKRSSDFFCDYSRRKVTSLARRVACFMLAATLPHALLAGPLKQVPLDNYVITRVPVATGKGNTTIMFPSPIQALYASRCAFQEQSNADFLLDFQPGQYWFTVRALKRDVEDFITVIYERKAYVIRINASETPLYTVSFFHQGRSDGGLSGMRPVSPARLLSLLDKAKAYNLFLQQEPDAVAGVLYDRPSRVCIYPKFRVVIDEVFRFEEDDTLVFSLTLENQTDTPIYYSPEGFAVQLKTNIYTASVVDASGIMPPQSATNALFAITGTPSGGRNNLAPKNNWNILITETERNGKGEVAEQKGIQGGEGK
jgi:hypothetical protein